MKASFTFFHIFFLLCILGTSSCVDDIPKSTLKGIITDAHSGECLADAFVELSQDGNSKGNNKSDKHGEYIIDITGVMGECQINVSKFGYISEYTTISLSGSRSQNFQLHKKEQLRLEPVELTFGRDEEVKNFDVINTGTVPFDWNITALESFEWIKVNPSNGKLQGNKSCTVQVMVDRSKLTKNADATFIVKTSLGDDESIKVKVDVVQENADMIVEPSELDFNTKESDLSFTVKNSGNTDKVKWSITGLDVDWLTLSPMSGEIDQGKSQSVKATLKRHLIEGKVKTSIIVNGAGNSYRVEIKAEKQQQRVLTVNPSKLEFGDEKKELEFSLTSQHGETDYSLEVVGESIGWFKLPKSAGKVPAYDAANPSLKESMTIKVDRSGLEPGLYTCTLVVKSDLDDIEVPVTMSVKEEKEREFLVHPSQLNIGASMSGTITLYSRNGATNYQLLTEDNVSWVTFEKSSGTVESNSSQEIRVDVNRAGFAPGEYKCTVIVRTDLVDTHIPLSMIVEEDKGESVKGSIVSFSDKLEFLLTKSECRYSMAEIEFRIKNISTQTIEFETTKKGYAIDDFGNQYEFNHVFLYKDGSITSGDVTIDPGSFILAQITIYEVYEKSSKLAYMNLDCTSPEQGKIQFKDLVLEGRNSYALPEPTTTGKVESCHDKLDFILMGCKRNSDKSVTVSFRVKNSGEEMTNLTFTKTGSAIDNLGNEYELGEKKLGFDFGTQTVSGPLPTGVWLKGSVTIENVDEKAGIINTLSINTSSPSESKLVLKDVVIEKR